MPFLKKPPPFTQTPVPVPLFHKLLFLTCHQSLSVQQTCRTIFHKERDCDAFKSSVDDTRDINKSCRLAVVMIQCRLCSAHHSLSGPASGGAECRVITLVKKIDGQSKMHCHGHMTMRMMMHTIWKPRPKTISLTQCQDHQPFSCWVLYPPTCSQDGWVMWLITWPQSRTSAV